MDTENSAEILCQRIKDDAQQEIDSILRKAERDAQLRIKLSGGESQRYLQEKLKEAEGKTKEIETRTLSTVNLQIKRIVSGAREEIIDFILQEVKHRGIEFRNQKEYPEWLKAVMVEGIVNLGQKEVVIIVSELDSKFINQRFIAEIKEELAKDNIEVNIEVIFDKSMKDTGADIKSGDGRIIFPNTFLSRMERLRNQLRLIIFREIFGNA